MTTFTREALKIFLENLYNKGMKDRFALEIEYYSEFLDVNADILETVWAEFEVLHPELAKKLENSGV
ncbi:hypothetical protein EB118_20210 [bacterium]|nr:hypothetical protein [bacterium]